MNFDKKMVGILLLTGIVFIGLLGYTGLQEHGSSPNPGIPSGPVDDTGRTHSEGIDASIVILEYSDFQCPFCSRVVPTINRIKEEYGSQVTIKFRHFPLSFHKNAKKAAEASECARDQDKFWEYHDKLFENQARLGGSDLKKYAGELGLDSNRFETCLDGGSKTKLVEKDFNDGQELGVTGTPTFFINGQKVVGAQPYEAFKGIIDTLIQVNKGE